MGMSEEEKLEREMAIRAHDRDRASQNRLFDTVIEYGQAALRSAALICGGSVLVSLAFVGTIYQSAPEVARQLMIAVILFAAGAVACGVASGFSYLAQARYAEASYEKTYVWEHPYIRLEEPKNSMLRKKGDFWRNQAIRMVWCAYLALIAGVVAFAYAIG